MEKHRIRRLKPGRPISLQVPRGTALLVAKGIGWLTSSLRPADHVLCAGQEYGSTASEHIIVEALGGTAVVAIKYPAPTTVRALPSQQAGGARRSDLLPPSVQAAGAGAGA